MPFSALQIAGAGIGAYGVYAGNKVAAYAGIAILLFACMQQSSPNLLTGFQGAISG